MSDKKPSRKPEVLNPEEDDLTPSVNVNVQNNFFNNENLTPEAIKGFKDVDEWDWVKDQVEDYQETTKAQYSKDCDLNRKMAEKGQNVAIGLSIISLIAGIVMASWGNGYGFLFAILGLFGAIISPATNAAQVLLDGIIQIIRELKSTNKPVDSDANSQEENK